MINKDKTLEKYGYKVESLAPTSPKKVCWSCDKCGSEKDYSLAYIKKKGKLAQERNPENPQELCQKCSHSHRKGKVSAKKTQGQTWQPLPPQVRSEKTVELFGYDPETLSPWSRRKIVVLCSIRNTEHVVRRCSLNKNKAVIEKGVFISTGAYTGARRKGVKVSAETKKSMVESQKKRRLAEKVRKERELQEKSVLSQPVSEETRL